MLRQEVQRLQMLETHSTGGVREGTQQPLDRMWQTSSTSGTGSWGHGPQGPPSAAWWQAQVCDVCQWTSGCDPCCVVSQQHKALRAPEGL